jgi:hypothetical protein
VIVRLPWRSLRLFEHQAAARRLFKGPLDSQLGPVEVYVLPAKRQQLAPAHAGSEGHGSNWIE